VINLSQIIAISIRALWPWAGPGRGGENIQGYGAGRAVGSKINIFRAGRASGRRANGPWRPYTLDHERNTTIE
jgi:hypothetical protein